MKSYYKLIPALCCAVLSLVSISVMANVQPRNFYQLKIYHYKTQAQEDKIDGFLKDAYVPAMHHEGVTGVGVFKPVMQKDTDRLVYVFTPFASVDKMLSIEEKLQADVNYLNNGKSYIDADSKDAPYTRIETLLLQAFPGAPQPNVPQLTAPKAGRVYELRSYESATEKYNVNKVTMFNVGDEIGLFKRLGFNAIFYSEVIAGGHMPNLMYMTTFNSKEDRDKHWEAFNNDPQWKALIANQEYKNNVSHADIFFLHPTDYSDY